MSSKVPSDILQAVRDLAVYGMILSKQIKSKEINQNLRDEDEIIRDKIYAIQDLIRSMIGKDSFGFSANHQVTFKITEDWSKWNCQTAPELKEALNQFQLNQNYIPKMKKARRWFSERYNLNTSTYNKFLDLEKVIIHHMKTPVQDKPTHAQHKENTKPVPNEIRNAMQDLANYAVELSQQIKGDGSSDKEDELIKDKIRCIRGLVDDIVGEGTVSFLSDDNYKNNVYTYAIPQNFQSWNCHTLKIVNQTLVNFKDQNQEGLKLLKTTRGDFSKFFNINTSSYKKFEALDNAIKNAVQNDPLLSNSV